MTWATAAGPGAGPADAVAGPVDSGPAVGDAPHGLGRSFLVTMLASGGTLVLTLVSGVLTARLLGTDGRGHVAAISAWLLTLSWGCSAGFGEAMVYEQSRRTAPDAQVLSTALLSIPVLGLLGVLLAEALVPLGFAAQSAGTQSLARACLLAVPLLLGLNTVMALLMGAQRFRALGRVRLAQPGAFTLALVALALAGVLTPGSVLLALIGSYALVLVASTAELVRSVGWQSPSLALARRGLGFGMRLQGVALGQLVTARLDLLLLPAFVVAADLGYYSIAVSIASMVAVLFGSLSTVVFPVASRSAASAASVVQGGLRLVLVGGAAAVVALEVLAPWLVQLVYGRDFVPAVGPLRLLLPGLVLWAASAVLGGGLQALGRPGAASLVQLAGTAVTVLGLALTLPAWGIQGAAVTSTVAYTITFALNLYVLRRAGGVSLRAALAGTALRADARRLVHALGGVVPGRAAGGAA